MAFDISKVGGYGTGSLGNVVVPYDTVSAYPSDIQTYTSSPIDYYGYNDCYPYNIYPEGLTEGGATLYLPYDYNTSKLLTVGSALLFVQMRHKDEVGEFVVNNNLSEEILAEYGKYEVRTITAIIGGGYYTFDQAPAMDFANYYVQIVPFLDFENLTLNSGGRLCMVNHVEGLAEGILAVRVKNTLTLNGGHIDLFAWGYINGSRVLLTTQEQNGTLDADPQAGQENFITKDRFLLNGGQEGGLFLLAKNIVVESADSRIGVGFSLWSTSDNRFFIPGVQYCRGAADSPNRPTDLTIHFPPGPYEAETEFNGVNATNKSGATILIACETFEGFTPALIAKYTMYQEPAVYGAFYEYARGKGLARCYIACKNPAEMKHDEGLYALDVLTDGDRLHKNRVVGFGNGTSGDVTNPAGQINSYAAITSINAAQVTLSNISNGSCPFEVGAMVMIHATAKSEPPENVSYVTLVGAATLSNLHIQKYVEPNDGQTINNSLDDATIETFNGNDTISNSGEGVSIKSGAGDDSIYSDIDSDTDSYSGTYVTIDAGKGNDTIVGQFGSSSISGGAGDDYIEMTGYVDNATINAGTGNDTIYLDNADGYNLVEYSAGDGNDVIYNFMPGDTLSIVGGTYSTLINGDDVLVQVGDGKITLVGAANLGELNIEGTAALQSKSLKFGSKALTAESGITNREDNATIYGTSGDDVITNYGKDCTIISGAGEDEIHLSSGSRRSVIIIDISNGENTYFNLGDTDTILVTLSGEEYKRELAGDYVKIKLQNGSWRNVPCRDGNIVSVTGGTLVEEFTPDETIKPDDTIKNVIPAGWIGNTLDNVTIYGTSDGDSIVNYGSNCTIWGDAGNDTISLASGSDSNVVITRFDDGENSYIGLNSSDTLLVSLNGGEYFSTVETDSSGKTYSVVCYGKGQMSLPTSSGNVVSVTGGTRLGYIRITNAQNGVSIIGGDYPEYITNTGSNVRISCGGGNDTVENRGMAVDIDLRSGRNVVNNSGAAALIYSSNGQNSISNSGASAEINFSGNDTISLDSGVKYNKVVARWSINQPVIYGFNGTTTLSQVDDYTLEPAAPDLKVKLSSSNYILLKNVYNNTGVIHIGDAAIAISPDEYTYNYAASDGNISIAGFNANSTLNVIGNFIWERHNNDIIVGVSENATPIMYTGDFSANDFPRDSDFKLAKVLTYSGGRCSLDTTFNATPDDYYLQLITIPQYKNFTLSTSYSATSKFENGRGGICALAVSNLCDLSGGKLNVENKGHGLNTGNELDGNAFMRNHLPLGNGHGSIFLLAKNIKMNSSTRIGATYSGAPTSNFTNYGGKRGSRGFGSKQGAHVLIVADKITGMNDAAISTGGDGAGAGYCGSDGVSGAAFICCNNTS